MSQSEVLVVDDSPMDRLLASSLLKKAGMAVQQAKDGVEALQVLDAQQPAVVVTDLQMPQMDGLQLVEAVRSRFPSLPVILMTAHGSEKVAAAALRLGASSYVSKRNLARDLASTVTDVLEIAQVGRREEQLVSNALEQVSLQFNFCNDLDAVPPLIRHIESYFHSFGLCDGAERLQAGVALREALTNAVYHGNLEVDSELMVGDGAQFYLLADERRQQTPYCDRRVHLHVTLTHEAATIVVRDEGPGFDPNAVPDPLDLDRLDRNHGRGLLLMRTFMDEVRHNDLGNEVTLVKRAKPG